MATIVSSHCAVSLLLDLPNELFYDVLWQIRDPLDLATLAQIPQLRARLVRFVRVVTGETRLFFLPKVFHDFPRFPLKDPAPEYSINLLEIDQATRLSRTRFNELFISLKHVRNFLMIIGIVEIKRTDHQTLEWIWPEVTVVEVETIKKEFNTRCVLVITEPRFTFTNCTFSTLSGHVTGETVKEFTLDNVTVVGWINMVNGVKPRVLNINNSSANWINAIDYPHVDILQINHWLPDQKPKSRPYTPELGFSPFLIDFQNLRFDLMRTLELNNVNCMKDVEFPLLESLHLQITGLTKVPNTLVVPVIMNLVAPNCRQLSVDFHYVLPDVKNVIMPSCETLTIRVKDLRYDLANDAEYLVGWNEYFGIPHSELYGTDPGADVDGDDNGTTVEHMRIVPQDIYGWPHAKNISLTDASHLFRNHDFLSDTTKLTVVFDNPMEESHIYIPESHGDTPELKSLTIIDKMSTNIAAKDMQFTDIFCPQYRVNAFVLEHLMVCRSAQSKLYLNFENMFDNFPRLTALHVQCSNNEDKFPADRTVLRGLQSLILEKYELINVVTMFDSLKESPLDTFIMGRTLRSRINGIIPDPSLPQSVCAELTRHFSQTMAYAIVDFDDAIGGEEPVPEISVTNMRNMRVLGVGGIKSLIIKGCPLLEAVQIRYGEEWYAAPLSSFENTPDGFKLDVFNFINVIREGDSPLSTTYNGLKRKTSFIISSAIPVRICRGGISRT